jgi:hypothetical protein
MRRLEPIEPSETPENHSDEDIDTVGQVINGNAGAKGESEEESEEEHGEDGQEEEEEEDGDDEEDQEDDEDPEEQGSSDSIINDEERTPEPMDDDDDEEDRRPQTRSSKGKSILRPRPGKVLPEPPASPPEDEDDFSNDSPIITRLKRKPDSNILFPTNQKKPLSSIETSSNAPGPNGRSSQAPPLYSSIREPEPLNFQPGRQWRCPGQECGTVLDVNPKTRDGRHAIEQHYEKHGKTAKEALQTIELEQQSSFLEGRPVK